MGNISSQPNKFARLSHIFLRRILLAVMVLNTFQKKNGSFLYLTSMSCQSVLPFQYCCLLSYISHFIFFKNFASVSGIKCGTLSLMASTHDSFVLTVYFKILYNALSTLTFNPKLKLLILS